MIELLKRIKACPDRDSLLDMLGAHFREQGFEGFGYMVPSTEEPGAMVFELRGLPEAWRNIYRDEGLSKSDPFPQYVARHRHPIQLSDVWKSGTLTPAEREFVGRAREGGITDGFLIPTFGSHQQMGIFALGQVTGPEVLQRADIDELEGDAGRRGGAGVCGRSVGASAWLAQTCTPRVAPRRPGSDACTAPAVSEAESNCTRPE